MIVCEVQSELFTALPMRLETSAGIRLLPPLCARRWARPGPLVVLVREVSPSSIVRGADTPGLGPGEECRPPFLLAPAGQMFST